MENYHELGRLFVGLARLHSTRADQLMDQIELFRGQGMLLKFLSKYDGQTLSEIAEKLEISPAAVTKVTKRLEEQNYLKRQPDPKDDRVSRVFIQPEGEKKIEEVHRIFQELDNSTFQGFTEEELEQLRGYLSRMQTNLQNNFPDPVAGDHRENRRHGFHRHF
jgi:DNA-binding MarR family transcriptional regulator